MVDLVFREEGFELLPDLLDDVWWESGHGRCSFRSGSVRNSPDDGASVPASHVDAPPTDGSSKERTMLTNKIYNVRDVSTTLRAVLNGPDIPRTTRNIRLTKIAGLLHDGTRTQEELVEDLHRVNKARCKPPLSRHAVEGIVKKNYSRWEPCVPSKGRPPDEGP